MTMMIGGGEEGARGLSIVSLAKTDAAGAGVDEAEYHLVIEQKVSCTWPEETQRI